MSKHTCQTARSTRLARATWPVLQAMETRRLLSATLADEAIPDTMEEPALMVAMYAVEGTDDTACEGSEEGDGGKETDGADVSQDGVVLGQKPEDDTVADDSVSTEDPTTDGVLDPRVIYYMRGADAGEATDDQPVDDSGEVVLTDDSAVKEDPTTDGEIDPRIYMTGTEGEEIVTTTSDQPDPDVYSTGDPTAEEGTVDPILYTLYDTAGTTPSGATLAEGKLTINGTDQRDRILVSLKQGDATKLVVSINGKKTTFSTVAVTKIEAYGFAGNDLIAVQAKNGKVNIPSELYGGDGNDQLKGGNAADRLSGGAGNDILGGCNGADSLDGGAGGDKLRGGLGNDVIAGSDGNDRVNGGNGDDRLDGGAGSDLVYGGAGADVLCGGTGKNCLRGGAGADQAQHTDDHLIDDDSADTALAAGRLMRPIWWNDGDPNEGGITAKMPAIDELIWGDSEPATEEDIPATMPAYDQSIWANNGDPNEHGNADDVESKDTTDDVTSTDTAEDIMMR